MELRGLPGDMSISSPRTSSVGPPWSGRAKSCSAVRSGAGALDIRGVYGWVHRSATLFEPGVVEQVVVDREQGAVVQQQRVVLARDGMLAPPLVVDAPVVLDAGDRARGEPPVAPHAD